VFPFGAARRKRGREDLSIRGNRGRRKRRGLTPRREGADRGARGLIEVSTFKVAKTRAVSRAHGRHYLFIYATFNYGRETAKLIAVPRRLPRDRDSRRYLHANSCQAQILPFRTRKNLHRGESGPRVRTERVRRYAYDRAVCHLRPAFRPPFHAFLPPFLVAPFARRVTLYCRQLRQSSDVTIAPSWIINS